MILNKLEKLLKPFYMAFPHEHTFGWFVIVIVGFLVRENFLGVSDVVRDLALNPACYDGLINFYHSDVWALERVWAVWGNVVCANAPLVRENDRVILIGDGCKVAKEGKRQPGTKRQSQSSNNATKKQKFTGVLLGATGILTGAGDKLFCTLLRINIQNGLNATAQWKGGDKSQAKSHTVQMIEQLFACAESIEEKAYGILDRYFLTHKLLIRLDELNAAYAKLHKGVRELLHIVTRAKMNCVAYIDETPEGADIAVPGEKKKLSEYFQTEKDEMEKAKKDPNYKYESMFKNEADIFLYNKMQHVRYFCMDLLWGLDLYRKLRFVFVLTGEAMLILVSTDLTLDPLQIIKLYSCRQKIEISFRTMTQVFCGFAYHFWSKYMPKRNTYAKKSDPEPIDKLNTVYEKEEELEHAQEKILSCIKAMNGFVNFAAIAMGIAQIISMNLSEKQLERMETMWMRTPSKGQLSERVIMNYLRHRLFNFMIRQPSSLITRKIREKQRDDLEEFEWVEPDNSPGKCA